MAFLGVTKHLAHAWKSHHTKKEEARPKLLGGTLPSVSLELINPCQGSFLPGSMGWDFLTVSMFEFGPIQVVHDGIWLIPVGVPNFQKDGLVSRSPDWVPVTYLSFDLILA